MRDKLLMWLLLAVAVFNVGDYFLTLQAISVGMAEGNPVMDAILHTPIFPLYKLGAVTAFICIVWVSRKHWNKLSVVIHAGVWLMFLVYGSVTAWHFVLWSRGYS